MSQVLDPPTAVHALSPAFDAINCAVGEARGVGLWQLSDEELMGSVAELHRLRCQTDALTLLLVREVDQRGAAVAAGAASTAAWLRHGLRIHPGAAKATVDAAAALHADPAGPLVPIQGGADGDDGELAAGEVAAGGLAAARAALAEGAISFAHVSVIARSMNSLPGEVDTATRREGEAFLVDHAREHDPGFLAKLGDRLLHHLDPDCGDRLAANEQHRIDNRELHVIPLQRGGYKIAGMVDEELGSALLSVLSPYAAPRKATEDGGRDRRSLGQRQADALADVMKLVMSHPDVSSVSGAKPTVVVTLDYATLCRQLGADAAALDWAGPISAEAARRLACDARIIPMVLGSNSEPLDVGRASYTFPTAIRRALIARDKGCAFPGCEVPPGWCDAHHIIYWADGGITSVSNGVLFCGAHHNLIHHGGWTVRIAANGLPEFTPPRWIDPTQTPRSKPWRAQLADLTTTRPPPE